MKTNFYKNMLQLKYDADLCQEYECTEEENRTYMDMINQKEALPDNIIRCEDSLGIKQDKFRKVEPLNLTTEQIQEYCLLQQTKDFHTIKNCAVFFVVAAISSFAISIFLLLLTLAH